MRIAILMTNTDESEFAQRHPKDGQKFTDLIKSKRPEWSVLVYVVKDNVFPEAEEKFDGLLITGSPASVRDNEIWIERLFDYIRQAHAQGVPMFGACFGHQAIAMALGGKVEANPNGYVAGQVETTLSTPWDSENLNAINLFAFHEEQVTKLPNNATNLGSTAGCKHASFAIGDTVWTTQYHPEMKRPFVTDLLDTFQSDFPDGVVEAAKKSLVKPVDRSRMSEWIVEFFERANAT